MEQNPNFLNSFDEKHNSGDQKRDTGSAGSMKRMTLKVLTQLQRLSAPFLSLFVAIHLAAPIAANFGGSDASNQMLLLGREYYQGRLTEPTLLFIPLGIHVGSSLLRRAILKPPKKPGLVTLTAYASLVSVPIHFYITRVIPSSPTPPISSFSPSELNYEFVKAGFTFLPLTSWVAYMGIVTVVLLHGAEGGSIINRWLTGKPLNKRLRRGVALLAAAATALGLYRISQEPLLLRGARLERALEIYRGFPPHRYLEGI
ncbi:hypothetical protein FRB91_007688 [Serendipita sp. 411]|nr:hypothetical protein FRC18_008291 [Serendipita sp. 400]KAG8851582.1 hypothetical protein FRB91_007688 [Serendipita sp. 411]